MADLIAWRPDETCDAAMRHLLAGRCVALPTEATYELVASALDPQALAAVARVAANHTPALVLFNYAELFNWLPLAPRAAVRLLHKLGPAPLVLRVDVGYVPGLSSRLASEAQALVMHERRLALRWPQHPVWNEVRRAGLPLVSVPIPGAFTAEAAGQALGDAAACVVNAGPTELRQPPTVARAEGRRCAVEQAGALTQEAIDDHAVCRILFLCTGNTCRSPLAEALCTKLLAERVGCAPGELQQHGFLVQSAGLAAMMGSEASPDGVRVAADLGADLSQHRSRLVSMAMLVMADRIYAMTVGHCYTLENLGLEGIVHPQQLAPDHQDIADPIGGELADYRTCAHQILECLRQRLPEIWES
jgi:protein-tyrosine phosphatase